MGGRKLNLFIAALVLASLGCGVINSVLNTALNSAAGGSAGLTSVSQLWSDVPRMDGLTPSTNDMPAPMKLIVRTVIGNLGRLNPQGENRTTGNIDWIAFTSSKTPDDVRNFYTNARMTASGWAASAQSTCFTGSEQGVPTIGLLCAFQKHQGSTQTQLAIIAAQDDQTKQTTLFFLRLEEKATPVPGQ